MSDFYGLQVSYVSPSHLIAHKTNPRTHSDKQIAQIAKSIQTFGFTNPILTDAQHNILAGHGRLLAAQSLKLDNVPTIKLEHMTAAQKRAYIIADNKLAENAGWDDDLLRLELGEILILDNEFDLEILGFDTGDLDFILLDEEDHSEPALPPLPDNPVSQLGDLWLLGRHRLYCGNALEQGSYEALLGPDKATMIFTDPPYNVPIAGHVCGKGSIKHSEFAMASGEMSEEEFTHFLEKTIHLLQEFSTNGSLHFLCMDWRHMKEMLVAASSYTEQKNLCIWNKTTGGMGSLYRSQHELVFVFKQGKGKHINNVNLGKHGRNRTNVWDYPGVNNFANHSKNEELGMHPTVKPIKMISAAIQDCSKRNDIILDCFGGSGSTLMAAQETGRRGALIELDPRYVDVTIERFQKTTGDEAILSSSGKTFESLKAFVRLQNV